MTNSEKARQLLQELDNVHWQVEKFVSHVLKKSPPKQISPRSRIIWARSALEDALRTHDIMSKKYEGES